MQEKIAQAFEWRAAVKSFSKEKQVPTDLLNSILEAGRMSATSYGLQPFRIVHVENKETRVKLLEASYGQMQVVDAPHLFVIAAVTNVNEEYIRKCIEHIAQVRGMSLEDLKSFEDSMLGAVNSKSADEKTSWAARQSYIALGAMLETAALLEVDAGPMEGFVSEKVDEILGLGEMNLKSIAYVVFGYRENDKYSEMKKVRLEKSEFIVTI